MTMEPLFTCDRYRHVLFYLLSTVDAPEFGAIGQLNQYCRTIVASATDAKVTQCLVPAPSTDPTRLWVNWRFSHNGLFHGDFRHWRRDRLKVSCTYRFGRLHGKYIEYDEHGGVKVICTYHDGVIHGRQIVMTRTKRIETDYVDGIKHGRCVGWYHLTPGPNNGIIGNKMAQCNEFVNGKLHGEYTMWYPDGAIKMRTSFVNGKEHGQHTWFYRNGQRRIECTYNNGLVDGTHYWWRDSGLLRRRVTYKEGKPILIEKWSKSGVPIMKMAAPRLGTMWADVMPV